MINKDTIQWFSPDENERQANNHDDVVKIVETEGVCEFCGNTKDVCEIKVDVPDNFENVDARSQKASLMMCDDCMDKLAHVFLRRQKDQMK